MSRAPLDELDSSDDGEPLLVASAPHSSDGTPLSGSVPSVEIWAGGSSACSAPKSVAAPQDDGLFPVGGVDDGSGGGGGGGGVAPAGTRSPGGTLRSAPPVVAALAAAAPQKFGLRPSENSVDGFNGNVSYAPDEFVAFIDPHGKARQPRLPWVARWVPKLHPPEAPHPTADADRESEEEEEDGETDLDQPSMAASKSRPSPGVGVRWGFARHTARAAADEEGDTDEWENEWGSVRDALPVERARPPAITPSPSGAKPRSLRKVAQALGLPVRQRHAAGAV